MVFEKKSKLYKLNKVDGLKIAKGAGIAVGGALLTYVASILNLIDFGPSTPIIVGLLSIGVNAGLKLLSGKN